MDVLKRMKYVHVRDKIVENAVKQVISVENHGIAEFNKLSKLMLEFFASPDYEEYLKQLD
jgi:hypothetical protein